MGSTDNTIKDILLNEIIKGMEFLSINKSHNEELNNMVEIIEDTIPILVPIESIIPIPISIEPIENIKVTKKRKSVEYNGIELLHALLIVYSDINDIITLDNYISNIDLIKRKILFNQESEISLYVEDLNKKKHLVSKIIINFRNQFSIFGITYDQIKEVYLSGKTNKHQIIKSLNKGIDRKYTKSDIYIKLTNDSFIGLSCKQDYKSTKSNYSVQKLLGKEADNILKQIKKKYLTDNGFEKFNKEQRAEVNKLFYPQIKDNIYWNTLKNIIEQKKIFVGQQLSKHLYCDGVPYLIYEFNGEKIYQLNSNTSNENITFEEHIPYYFDVKGNQRNAAKLFYRLCIGEKNYRVEIRWKGKIHGCSPQFQIHEE
jgi:hypothetical protein